MIAENSLVTAKDIAEFAGRKAARSLLPHVVRRLLSDTPGVHGLSMPAGEEVWRDGWDGYVEHAEGNAFVPSGSLRWEMSTEKNPHRKAEEDYQKRTADPLGNDPSKTTFIFATMRRWRDKEKWAQKKRDQGTWKDVRAIDADDLWAWLESNKEVHAWLSKKMGRRPYQKHSNPRSPSELPAEEYCFVGRNIELKQMNDSVEGEQRGGLMIISGHPGVGKTALAVRFAHEKKSDYRDGQIYIDLRGTDSNPLTIETVLTRILRTLNVPARQQQGSTDEMAAVFRTVSTQRRFILVLDNAADEQQVRPLIPGNSQSIVIATSRGHLGGLDCIERIRLGNLPENNAIAMLTEKIGSERAATEPESVACIARICGYLPLALQIASRLAEQAPSWRLQYLAGRLSDEQSRLDRLKIGDLEVRASFQLSYELLANEPRAAFRKLCLIPGPTFDVSLAKVTLGYKKISKVESVLQLLTDRGLIQISFREGRYHIHDLLRIFGKERTEEEEGEDFRDQIIKQACGYLFQGAKEANLAILPENYDEHARRIRESVQTGDALVWLDENYENIMSALQYIVSEGLYNSAIGTIIALSIYLEVRAEWTKLHELASMGCDVIDRVKSKGTQNDASVSFVYSSMLTLLAKSTQGLRKFDDALYYCDQADAHRGSSEQDRMNSINTLNVRGLILRSLNRYDEALEIFKKCEEYWHSIGIYHQQLLVEHNIGATLMDMGKLSEALPYLYRDLQGCKDAGDQLGEAHALNTIGLAWGRLGEYEASIKTLARSASYYRKQNDRIHEGYALNDLGLILHKQEKYDMAYKCHLIDLAYCQERRDWNGASRALVRLADNLIADDRKSAGIALHYVKVALGYLEESSDQYAFAAALVIMADLGYALSQEEYSAKYYQSAFDIYRELGDYEGQIETLTRQSGKLRERGDFHEALDIMKYGLSVTREYDRPLNEAQVLREMAEILQSQGMGGQAEEHLNLANQIVDNRNSPTPDYYLFKHQEK